MNSKQQIIDMQENVFDFQKEKEGLQGIGHFA